MLLFLSYSCKNASNVSNFIKIGEKDRILEYYQNKFTVKIEKVTEQTAHWSVMLKIPDSILGRTKIFSYARVSSARIEDCPDILLLA